MCNKMRVESFQLPQTRALGERSESRARDSVIVIGDNFSRVRRGARVVITRASMWGWEIASYTFSISKDSEFEFVVDIKSDSHHSSCEGDPKQMEVL